MPSMSFRNSGLASTSTLFVCGCGWLETTLLDSRLGEKPSSTARRSGVPARAT